LITETVSWGGRQRIRWLNLAYRMQRRIAKEFWDVDLWQLRRMQRAYRTPGGPEVLVLGDSHMFWTGYYEADRRRLGTLIREELGPGTRVLIVEGPCYWPNMTILLLEALLGLPHRPRVLLFSINSYMNTPHWLEHPQYSYAPVVRTLRENLDRRWLRKVPRVDQPAAEAYYRKPASSFGDAHLTLGELEMLVHGKAHSSAQRAARRRHRIDFYFSEALAREMAGADRVERIGALVAALDVPTVNFVGPLTHDAVREEYGDAAYQAVVRQVEDVVALYSGKAGARARVLDFSRAFATERFVDPLHVNASCRIMMARALGREIREALQAPMAEVSPISAAGSVNPR
jgi:hypothetical protein